MMNQLTDAINHSNAIESVPIDTQEWRNHFAVGRAVIIAASVGQLLHPRVLHSLLFEGVSIPFTAGEYRNVAVRVGSYLPPKESEIPRLMHDWWIQAEQISNPWESHIGFEAIHPFQDGNGRVGRLVMWNKELLTNVALTVIRYDDRLDYYTRLETGRIGKGV